MADITVTATDVRPLPGATIERFIAGGAITVGDTGYMASDGDIEEAAASAVGTTYAIGVVVSVVNGATDGATVAAAGDTVELVTWGKVTGFSGMTPHDVLYQSNTAGTLADAAGTTSHKFARARSATTIFVQPPMTEA